MSLSNPSPLRCAFNDCYIVIQQFDTNGTGDPDGLDPNWGSDLAVARSAEGIITLTFSESRKPLEVKAAFVNVLEDDANQHPKIVSYVAATGVLTLKTFVNSGGTITVADTTDKTLQVMLICSRDSRS